MRLWYSFQYLARICQVIRHQSHIDSTLRSSISSAYHTHTHDFASQYLTLLSCVSIFFLLRFISLHIKGTRLQAVKAVFLHLNIEICFPPHLVMWA